MATGVSTSGARESGILIGKAIGISVELTGDIVVGASDS